MTLRAMYVAPLVVAGAAFAATGFADPPLVESASTPAPATAQMPAPSETLAPGETLVTAEEPVVASQPMPERAAAPLPVRAETSSTTTVYGERRSEDQFITDDVVKALAAEPRISGKIGVDTYRRVVTLTGRVSTQGQVDRITRVAQRAVDRDVEIHNQVGAKV